MKKIAIMAAGGFVGRSLYKYFSEKPEDYCVLPVTRKDFSLLDDNAVADFLQAEKPDIVFNCANEGGARKNGYGEQTDIVANNLRMFFNICRNISPDTMLINFGSGAQYAKNRDLINIREDSLGEVLPGDAYGFSKFIMAKYIDGSAHRLTLNPTIFGLFGPFEDYTFKFISNACVKNLLHLDIIINQNVRFDYLYIDDFCRILERLMLAGEPAHRNFNITPTASITLTDAVDIINSISDYKSRVIVRNPGLNYEYTGDNGRLLDNLGGCYDFLDYKEAIGRLYNYYKEHLAELDTAAIINDEALKFCRTKNQ